MAAVAGQPERARIPVYLILSAKDGGSLPSSSQDLADLASIICDYTRASSALGWQVDAVMPLAAEELSGLATDARACPLPHGPDSCPVCGGNTGRL